MTPAAPAPSQELLPKKAVEADAAAPSDGWLLAAAEILLILAVFFVHASWPVPDTNEPQYLGKAKHYWNPEWRAGDFFLETADAHLVFYWTFGWLSLWLPLPALAWTGRVVTWALLAWAWRRLSWTVTPRPWVSVLTAALWVMFNERAQMAGEWVVGGVEAKGSAYVFVLLAIEAIVRRRWNTAWLLLGAASAFHVLVGGWTVLAAGLAWLMDGRDRPRLREMAPGLGGGFLLALIGLAPAIYLTLGAPADVVRQANQIYVFERLTHHLLIDKFKEGFVGRHVLMGALFVVLCAATPAAPGVRRLRWVVAGAMAIATIGFILSYGFDLLAWAGLPAAMDWKAALLKFYWYRMSDSLVPLGVALSCVPFASWVAAQRPAVGRWCMTAAIIAPLLYLAGRLSEGSLWDAPRADKALAYDDWIAACEWTVEQTSPSDLFLTPRNASTFGWYTSRREVATWKDIPQDARSMVEWWKRFCKVHERPKGARTRWYDSFAEMEPGRLQQLAAEFNADYAVVAKLPGLPPLAGMPPIYENASYAIYRMK